MSQSGLQAVRSVWEEAARVGGSVEQLDYWYEHVWAEDIDYRAIEGAVDDRGPIHGRDEMRRYAEDWFETVDDFRLDPVEVIDAGDGVVVVSLRLSGRARGSDHLVQQHVYVVWTMRDSKIARGREYATREEAVVAAGLLPTA